MAVEVVTKCTTFCSTMEKSAKDLFKDYVTADKTTIVHKDKKDAKKKYEEVKVTFKVSDAKVDKTRTGAEQAVPISTNHSWTCISAHMADKARHVVPYLNGKKVADPNKSFKPLIAEYKKKWVAAMGSDLVNCAGKKAYHSDQYHLELKDAKKGIPQKEIDACYSTYVDLTKVQFPKKNTDFEKDHKALLDKLRKKKGILTDEEWKKKQEAEKRLEEIKKMTFDESFKVKGPVCKNAGAGKYTFANSISMLPKDVSEFGKRKDTAVKGTKTIVSKTYSDVKIVVTLSYTLVSFEHLSQSFLENPEMQFEIKIAGLLAKAAGVTISCDGEFSLKKSSKQPVGRMTVSYFVDGISIDDDKGTMMMVANGNKVS